MKYLLENLYDVEEKYKDEDVYYTFTGLEKVGINPHSNFTESPNAIYAYSMKDIKPTQTPFQGAGHVNTIHDSSNKKIGSGLVYVFELKDVKHLDFQKYKEDDFAKDLKILGYDIKDIDKINEGILEVEKRLAKLNVIKYTREVKNFAYKIYRFTDYLSKQNHNMWNKILREKLGYEYLIDHGNGYIHPAEPAQVAILSIKPIKLIDKDSYNSDEFSGLDPRTIRQKLSMFYNDDKEFFEFYWKHDFIELLIKNKIYLRPAFKNFFLVDSKKLSTFKHRNIVNFYNTMFYMFNNRLNNLEIVDVFVSLFLKYGPQCLVLGDEKLYNTEFISTLFNNLQILERKESIGLFNFILKDLDKDQLKGYIDEVYENEEENNLKYLSTLDEQIKLKLVDAFKQDSSGFNNYFIFKDFFKYLSPKECWDELLDHYYTYEEHDTLDKVIILVKDQLIKDIPNINNDKIRYIKDKLSLKECYRIIEDML